MIPLPIPLLLLLATPPANPSDIPPPPPPEHASESEPTSPGPRRTRLPPLPPEALGAPAVAPENPPTDGFALRLEPAARLALGVVEAVGARMQRVQLEASEGVTAEELEALRAELAKGGVFAADEGESPQGVLRLTRSSPAVIVGRLIDPAGAVVWEGEVPWAAAAPEPRAADGPPLEVRLRTYFQRALSVRDVARTQFLAPAQDRASAPGHLINPSHGDANADIGGPLASVESEWHLFIGDERVTELAFAQALADSDLIEAVEGARFNNVLVWTLSLAGGAAACAGAGVPLLVADIGPPSLRSDLQVAGASLVIVSAALAAVAVAYPFLPQRQYYQSRHEAELRAAEHNRRLMLELDLTPVELRSGRLEGASLAP